ncbi:Rhodanese-like domain-containing protein [Aspergillus aurantiobrunneus]
MAPLASIRPRPGDIASLVSRTAKYALPGERTPVRNLSSTRQPPKSCLARPNHLEIGRNSRSSSLQTTNTPLFPPVPLSTVRCKSSKSSTPTFRQWGFEDINALLPSTNPETPPSTPQKHLILVDVREPAELTSTGIIPSAVAVPLASQPDALFLTPDEFETRFGYPKPGVVSDADANAGGDIVFYCKAGVRARAAAQLAVQAGYEPERIGVYDGSWLDWEKHGGRVEKWEGDGYE